MSLILDALRKSEAERRRGQSPDLFAAALPAPGAAHPRRKAAIAVVAVACLVLAAVLLWPRPGTAPASPLGPPEQAGVETPRAHPQEPPMQPLSAADNGTGTAPPPAPLAKPEAAASPTTTAPAVVAGPGSALANRPPAAALPSPAIAPASDPSIPPAPTDELVPPIAVLGASERALLPPMKLSMHVWNSEAGKRFAIIDGQRIAEGSLLGSSVVEEIRRDGVVLNINGRRVLLSRP